MRVFLGADVGSRRVDRCSCHRASLFGRMYNPPLGRCASEDFAIKQAYPKRR